MGKLEKLIELFLRQPPVEQRSKGSHHTFSDPDGKTIMIPKVSGQKVKNVKSVKPTDWKSFQF